MRKQRGIVEVVLIAFLGFLFGFGVGGTYGLEAQKDKPAQTKLATH